MELFLITEWIKEWINTSTPSHTPLITHTPSYASLIPFALTFQFLTFSDCRSLRYTCRIACAASMRTEARKYIIAAYRHFCEPLVTKVSTRELLLYGNNSRGYRCIRTQHRSSPHVIKKSIALGYDRHIMTIPYDQRAVNLWHVVRRSFTGASFRMSECTINTGVEEEELVAAIHAANLKQRTL